RRPRRPPTGAGAQARTMVVAQQLDLERIALAALAEDVGSGDVTTEATVAVDATCAARLLLKEPGVVCGLPVVDAVFRALDPDVSFDLSATDGDRFEEPTDLGRISGRARAVLTGERTALNLLGRLSGIATLTRRFVDAIEGTGAEILDTRKTTPGLRALEKDAVRGGGGRTHRCGLDDGIRVKDNHLRAAGGVRPAVELLRAAGGGLPIEVEAETLDDVREALAAGTEQVLLDNMSPALMREAVELVAGKATLEASGGVSLETVREIAETGVDFVSVGALTHSARSLDVSLELA
ncbi:MAG TPA: carboxylating nicotinate-nucleotide diphosphorylase, partial [Gaiellaceae bacterium]|nr:carboxylating nicotinate-nucleotide diphosphorylase [Gaiellaceae bacterium]